MATRSRIGIQLKDGSIRSCYHHWDGYPDWLGMKLQENYNSRQLAYKLIYGGDMSSCWTDERWTKNGSKKGNPRGPQYYSSRGEKTPSVKDSTLAEYLNRTDRCCGQYAYLFVNDEWLCFDCDGRKYMIPQPKVVVSV